MLWQNSHFSMLQHVGRFLWKNKSNGTTMCWVHLESLNNQRHEAFWKCFCTETFEKRCLILSRYHTCVQVTTWLSHIALISDCQCCAMVCTTTFIISNVRMSGQPWHVWMRSVTNVRLALSSNHKVTPTTTTHSPKECAVKLLRHSSSLSKNEVF